MCSYERWRAGVETQKNVRGEIGGRGRVPFNEPYAPSLSTIYDGAQGSLIFLKMVLDPSPPPLVHIALLCFHYQAQASHCMYVSDMWKYIRFIETYIFFTFTSRVEDEGVDLGIIHKLVLPHFLVGHFLSLMPWSMNHVT